MPNSAGPSPTAQALTDAAIDLFGAYGYHGVSTRMLSEQAGTNVAAIRYHFGGKDELYRASIEAVVEVLQPRLALARAAFDQGRALAGADSVRQARLIADLLDALLDTFLGNPDMQRFLPLILREFSVPGPHFDRFYQALPRQLHLLFADMVAMVDGCPADDPVTILRAHALIGQLMVFNIGRPILFRRLGWRGYNPTRIRAVAGVLRPLLLSALKLPEVDA